MKGPIRLASKSPLPVATKRDYGIKTRVSYRKMAEIKAWRASQPKELNMAEPIRQLVD